MSPQDRKKIRVLIAETHPVLGLGVSKCIEWQPDMEVVARIADGPEVVKQALRLRPDVVLITGSWMPSMPSVNVMRAIKRKLDSTAVIILSSSMSEEERLKAQQEGAAACLRKDVSLDVLSSVIRACAQ